MSSCCIKGAVGLTSQWIKFYVIKKWVVGFDRDIQSDYGRLAGQESGEALIYVVNV